MSNPEPPKMAPEPPPQMRGETEAEYQAALQRERAREALIHYAQTGQTTDIGGHVDHGPEEPVLNPETRPPADEPEASE